MRRALFAHTVIGVLLGGQPGPAERAALRAEKAAEYEDTLFNPYIAAERGFVDAIIRPAETRPQIIRGLRALHGKRQTLPPKKHGNIPL